VAVRNPDRIERMAMVACGGLNPVLDIPEAELAAGVPFPMWDGTEESMREMLTTIVYRTEALDDDLIRARTEAAVRQREAFAAAVAYNRRVTTDPTIRQALRLTGHLDQLTMPMIYLYGQQDVLGPVANAYLQEDRLPSVQFLYPDQCGHQGQTDQPEMFNTVFTEFFTAGSLTRATAEWAGISRRRPEQPWAVRPDGEGL
jgi:pimeloyl-ACP methyl ester carboxylesterase